LEVFPVLHSNIEKLRKVKGVSRSTLAQKLGMTNLGYWLTMTMRSPLSEAQLEVIAAELGFACEILRWDGLVEDIVTHGLLGEKT
jgi:transcriptional regulator with XRE-family HTH domain